MHTLTHTILLGYSVSDNDILDPNLCLTPESSSDEIFADNTAFFLVATCLCLFVCEYIYIYIYIYIYNLLYLLVQIRVLHKIVSSKENKCFSLSKKKKKKKKKMSE